MERRHHNTLPAPREGKGGGEPCDGLNGNFWLLNFTLRGRGRALCFLLRTALRAQALRLCSDSGTGVGETLFRLLFSLGGLLCALFLYHP